MRSLTPFGKLLGLAALVSLLGALPWVSTATELERSSLSSGTKRRLCTPETLDECLNGVGGAVTALDNLRVTASTPRNRDAAEEEKAKARKTAFVGTGMSAGEGEIAGFSVWGSGSWNNYDSQVDIAPYEGTTWSLLVGADRTFAERFILGATLGFETTDTDTFYNGGGQNRKGLTLAGYGAYLINDIFSVDISGGASTLDNDETRLAPNNGARLLGSYDSRRYFVAGNLNAVYMREGWVFGGRLGLLWAKENQNAYTETGASTQARSVGERDVSLTQFSVGGDIGYSIGALEPFVTAIYRYDIDSNDGASAGGLPGGIVTQPDDDDEYQLGVGVRYFGENGISGSVEWLHTGGRQSFTDDAVTLTVRVPL